MIRFRQLSLRLRLTLLFVLVALVAWGCAGLVAWWQATSKLDKLFDTQQIMFAKRLSTLQPDEFTATQPMAHAPKKVRHSYMDDDTLAFAIYSSDGKMLLNDGENGRDIPYRANVQGFVDDRLNDDDDEWRFFWLTTPDGRHRIVVGQEEDYRQELVLDIITGQLTPWLVVAPLMFLLIIVLLHRELRPLTRLAQVLDTRSADSPEPVEIDHLPTEVRPLLDALNSLFVRTHSLMARERRFTSDAAHELRTPLTALKVQTEVAQLLDDDPAARGKALSQLHDGIDRAARLVDQLLTLSRLDSLDQLQDVQPIRLDQLLQSAVMDHYHTARQAGIELKLHITGEVTQRGQPLLLGLLLRNLLDNAIRYSPHGSVVDITLETNGFSIRDNGAGVDETVLARLGERFYRPPGQTQTGSGLGLSIVCRIAALHRMTATFHHAVPHGLVANLRW